MNKYELFEAFGGIDDDLLDRSEAKPRRRFAPRKLLIAAAAVMLMAFTAFAAPAIRTFFFGSEPERIRNSVTHTFEDGTILSMEGFFTVDLIVPDAENAPTVIEEYLLPGWFAEKDWDCIPSSITPDRPYLGAHWLFQDPDVPENWAFFTQEAINQMPVRGTDQFHVNVNRSNILTEHPFRFGEIEGTLYLSPAVEEEGQIIDPGLCHLVWSDGVYAYLLTCSSSLTDRDLGQIAQSLVVIEDILPYVTEEEPSVTMPPPPPMEEVYTLPTLPENYKLVISSYDESRAWQRWEQPIYPMQTAIQLDQHSVCESYWGVKDYLMEIMTGVDPYTMETVTENGCLIYLVHHAGDSIALWETEGCCFKLRFCGTELSWEELLDQVRSLTVAEDLPEYLAPKYQMP